MVGASPAMATRHPGRKGQVACGSQAGFRLGPFHARQARRLCSAAAIQVEGQAADRESYPRSGVPATKASGATGTKAPDVQVGDDATAGASAQAALSPRLPAP